MEKNAVKACKASDTAFRRDPVFEHCISELDKFILTKNYFIVIYQLNQ